MINYRYAGIVPKGPQSLRDVTSRAKIFGKLIIFRYFTVINKLFFPPSAYQPRSQALRSCKGEDPGRSWSRVTRISRDKFEIYRGRGGRGACVSCLKMLGLEIRELVCVLHCFCYMNTSKKSDMYTIAMTSSKSSIELHVSYFKGHLLSNPLHSRRWLNKSAPQERRAWERGCPHISV